MDFQFPNSVATFLPYEFSNHSPCLLNLAYYLPTSGIRPFKFLNFLSTHFIFLSSVEAIWIQSKATDMCSLGSKLKRLKRTLKMLNRVNFLDIQKRVSDTNSLLKVVHVQGISTTSSFQTERNLHLKWNHLRGIEESFFRQTFLINLLREGAQNTSYFHKMASTRNSYSSIRSLTLRDRQVITNTDEMSAIAISHFQSIMAHLALPPLSSTLWFHDLLPFRCSSHIQRLLSSPPFSSEITSVIKKLNPN